MGNKICSVCILVYLFTPINYFFLFDLYQAKSIAYKTPGFNHVFGFCVLHGDYPYSGCRRIFLSGND